MKAFAIAILGFLAGMGAHVLWGSRSPAEAAPAAAAVDMPSRVAGPRTAEDIDWQRLRTEVRTAVREELAQSAHRAAESSTPTPAAAPTDEQKKAAAAQAQLLQHAIQAGVWRDEDAVHLRALLPQIAPADRFAALAAVSKAINTGQVRLEAHSPF